MTAAEGWWLHRLSCEMAHCVLKRRVQLLHRQKEGNCSSTVEKLAQRIEKGFKELQFNVETAQVVEGRRWEGRRQNWTNGEPGRVLCPGYDSCHSSMSVVIHVSWTWTFCIIMSGVFFKRKVFLIVCRIKQKSGKPTICQVLARNYYFLDVKFTDGF